MDYKHAKRKREEKKNNKKKMSHLEFTHTLIRRSDWCEIHTLNDLIGASNISLSVR